mmetsp:Transcript_69925/g.182202  ORF Transcript_69925/g.182202 Transcript_69925/m.182202 type:complete len:227 (+) Transcript_69925:300-980(+)
MSCRGQNALALRGLVDGRGEDPALVHGVLRLLARNPMHVRDLREQHLRQALSDDASLVVPSGTVHEEPVDEAPILWLFELGLGLLENLEGPHERVDGQLLAPCEVLQLPGEEGLGEVEARQPERDRYAALDPVSEEVQPRAEVGDIRGHRLQRWVGHLLPVVRLLVQEDARGDLLELGAHHHEPLHRQADVDQGGADADEELVEPEELLVEHRVHGLVVVHRVHRL